MVEAVFQAKLAELKVRVLDVWQGHEREAVIEIVRAADEAAFATRFFPEDDPNRKTRRIILSGVAGALATFLPAIKHSGPGLPFSPTNDSRMAWIDSMLIEFGKLAELQRIAAMERYGLARCEQTSPREIKIEVAAGIAELMDRRANQWLRAETMDRVAKLQGPPPEPERITALLDASSAVHDGWFIRYEGDGELLGYYQERAITEVLGYPESEALAHDAEIGGRLFAEWRATCFAALARVFNHIAYATRLRHLNPKLTLRNLLTVPVLKKDAEAVWIEAGDDPARVEATISHLMLDADSVMPWSQHHEIPAPFYIDVGGGWLLLPMFGGLLNPICGLVRTLRLRHPREWDKTVGMRETYFRADLQNHFRPPRFVVLDREFVLRRNDGTHLTDLDAAILDNDAGSLALVQLKWPDIFGMSLRERESRRLNLLKANEWVERVHGWIDGRSAHNVAKVIGLSEGGSRDRPPILLVIPRYNARFTLNDTFDHRAGWISWPELVRSRAEEPMTIDPLVSLFERFRSGGPIANYEAPEDIVYGLRDMEVVISVKRQV